MTLFTPEWAPQSAVLIAWPHASGDFGGNLAAVWQCYQAIADAISRRQRLLIVCRDAPHQRQVRALVGDCANISFIHAQVDDIWVRDSAFLTVERAGEQVLLNFRFNGWGGKYPHANDDLLNKQLAAQPFFRGLPVIDVDFVLEGGSVDSDGLGTVLTTRQCLLNPNRNPGLSQRQIEQALHQWLGARRVLWLEQANLPGDDTDAHIDTLARFCDSGTIAHTACEDASSPLYPGLKDMEAQLRALRTGDGQPYRLVALPLPKPMANEAGRPLPANYANFLIINGAVLVPVYGDDQDTVALARLADCFPGRDIVPIPCGPLVGQYGSLHCMTMQFPLFY